MMLLKKKEVIIEISDEEKERIKFLALFKFKTIVKKVIGNLKWLLDSPYETPDEKQRVKILYEYTERKCELNSYDRSILMKLLSRRTEYENSYLYKRIGQLNLYKLFTAETKRMLINSTYFTCYSQDRVILKEGQQRNAIYYIVDGTVSKIKNTMDIVTKKWSEKQIEIIKNGDIMGKQLIFPDLSTTFTYKMLTACELLYIRKKDFDKALEQNMQKQWDEIKHAMSRFTYFSALDESEIKEGCISGKIKTFKISETILGDGVGLTNHVYFVLSGKCQLIEVLYVIEKKNVNKITYKHYNAMVKDDEQDVLKKSRLHQPKKVFMEVCVINEGGCFNLGESFENRRIVAVDEVKCMLLPSYWLWQKNTADVWSRVKHFLTQKIPTSDKVFKQFVLNNEWTDYKDKLLDEIVGKKNSINTTTIHDIPYWIRINNNIY